VALLLALLLVGADTIPRPVPSDTGKADTIPVPAESVDVIYYGGRRVIYNAREAKVYLMDSAWVRYEDLRLNSDSIIYDIKKHLLSSYKHSYFRTATDSVIGTELHYNVDLRKGEITAAATQLSQGFFTGRDLWLVREKTLDVNDGTYTTCDHKPPHYTFAGRRVKALLDDMVIVEPVVLKIGKVPIAAAPFWFIPIAKNRKSGLLPFKVGNSKTEGFYAKGLSWYWAMTDYSDATFVLDVMSRKGIRGSMEGIYRVGPYASGQFLGSYINELDTRSQRYSIAANHGGRFLFGSRVDARADFQSDASYVSDYSENPVQWLKNELDSYLNVSRSFSKIGSGNITARRYVDLQNHRSQLDFPTFGLSLVSIPLPGGWTLSSGLSAANSRQTQDSLIRDTLTGRVIGYDSAVSLIQTGRSISPSLSIGLPHSFLGGLTLPLNGGYSESKSVHHSATGDSVLSQSRQARAGTGLGFSQNLFGFLSVSEGIGYNQTVNFLPESTHTNASYGLNAGSRFSLYRIFGIEALGVHGMLHKVSPGVTFNYAPQTRSAGFFGVPRLDTAPANAQLGLGLGNDFQIKTGDSVKTKRDLGNLNLGSGYDFNTRKFSNVSANLDLYLLELDRTRCNLTGNTNFDPYGRRFTRHSLTSHFSYSFTLRDTITRLDREFSISLSHFLAGDTTITDNMLTAELKLAPQGWGVRLSGGWNIIEHKLTDYRLDVVKDLHCWELVGNLSRLGDRWSYDFKVRIKAIPDVSVGKGLVGWLLPQ
jgi:hypothetical protein